MRAKLAIGQAQYSALLYPEGTFVDDVIVHRLGVDEYLLVINAGTREKDFNWVRDNTRQFDCMVENLSDDYTQIAIQGPKAVDLMEKLNGTFIDVPAKGLNAPFQKLRIDADYKSLKFYWITQGRTMAMRGSDRLYDSGTLIGRTGYTAEDGFEIYISSDEAISAHVWYGLLEAGKEFGAVPCGLGARNTLRLEGKLPLYGHEISDTINVWEAGLDRWCKMEKAGVHRPGGAGESSRRGIEAHAGWA